MVATKLLNLKLPIGSDEERHVWSSAFIPNSVYEQR